MQTPTHTECKHVYLTANISVFVKYVVICNSVFYQKEGAGGILLFMKVNASDHWGVARERACTMLYACVCV